MAIQWIFTLQFYGHFIFHLKSTFFRKKLNYELIQPKQWQRRGYIIHVCTAKKWLLRYLSDILIYRLSIFSHLLTFFLYRNSLGSHRISGFMYNRNKLKYRTERKRKHHESAQLKSCSAKSLNATPEETIKGKE